ncbi:MAG: restriction endonuclease subunit S [Planctomycetaceae bacterium]|nr:restriction endonuclease subunit S [Planctomycetaceae bacterium]
MLKVSIRIPPLAEQRRIVGKIEALQERSRKAREALNEVGPLLEQFRQSLLAAAFRGDLTADWRAQNPHTEPATELLNRIRTERRKRWEQAELAKYEAKGKQPPKGWQEKYQEPEPVDDSELEELPEGWCWCQMKDVGDVQLGRQRSPKYHSGPNMRPYLRVMNVFEDRIDTGDVMEMDFSPEDFERFRLEVGDILLNEGQSRELVGRPAIYRGEVPDSCFTNTLVRFRPDSPLTSDYPQIVFLGFLKTGRFQQIASLTVNIAHLGAGRFADMAFPLPPLEEQAEIVRQARTGLNQIKELERLVTESKSSLTQLDQSTLVKAFRGELVPQDPNDEPASVLLNRIREAREVSGSRRQGSGKKKGKRQ